MVTEIKSEDGQERISILPLFFVSGQVLMLRLPMANAAIGLWLPVLHLTLHMDNRAVW